MKLYNVTGMSCAACSATVEKAVKKVVGVEECSVSLLTNSMTVNGNFSDEDIISAVEKAGYGISSKSEHDNASIKQSSHAVNIKKETSKIKVRLISSIVLLLILMYISMGYNMLKLPLPSVLGNNSLAIGILQLLLSGCVMIINNKFFINGFKGLMRGSPNMDTLVALGSFVSFSYSVGVLFVMTHLVSNGTNDVSYMLHELYFESAAMILVLITIGKLLESKSKGKSADALNGLIKLAPSRASVIRDGKEESIEVNKIKVGDIFVVRAGESIALDGYVTDGQGSVDESTLTGESIPVDKKIGDSVSAGTINKSGYMLCRATCLGEDTALSKIIKTVSEASASKAPIARIADKISGVFVPIVIAIAILTLCVWLIVGESFGFALVRGISVLVISCPCALGLATPVAIMVGNGVGAKNNILFKNAESLENAGKIKVVALDKTGTLTKGQPVITDIVAFGNVPESELLKYAYSLEIKSEHPLALAVVKYAESHCSEVLEIEKYETFAGNGLAGEWCGNVIAGGNYKFISRYANIEDNVLKCAEAFSNGGKTPVYFSLNKEVIGIIAIADTLKDDSVFAVQSLKKLGIYTVMLTGDTNRTASAIADMVGVDEVYSEVLPDEKEKVIRDLTKKGLVAMVGDGINDAPALISADVGISIGAGTDIAIDSADIVLMKNKLTDVVSAIKISRATLRNIHQNLFWAFFYNAVGIPLAAGAFIHLLGWKLTPMFGALAMSLSSFCVVTNALRLNFVKLNYNDKTQLQELSNPLQKTLIIKGMMCEHCENRVKNALLEIDGVTGARCDYKSGKAYVTIDCEIDETELINAVEKDDYKVKKII